MIHFQKDGVTVRDAVGSDVAILKNRLREKDAQEVLASGAADVESELAASFAHSPLRYTIERHGVPVAMFGARPDTVLGDSACVWLLGTDELARFKKTFMRGTGFFLAQILERYPVLYNRVDARYVETVRWLKAFGAHFFEPEPFGPQGQPFMRFVIRRA